MSRREWTIADETEIRDRVAGDIRAARVNIGLNVKGPTPEQAEAVRMGVIAYLNIAVTSALEHAAAVALGDPDRCIFPADHEAGHSHGITYQLASADRCSDRRTQEDDE